MNEEPARERRVGILHPGAMGVSLAASAAKSGFVPVWLSAGRSAATRARAEEHGLEEARSIDELCETCETVISICPPHAAADVAAEVRNTAFAGVYADVNAIAPQRVREIGALMTASGVTFVDGGIIGGPAWEPGTTLYLSGDAADQVAKCFSAGPLDVKVIEGGVGQASALKMCFAANTKGTAALQAAIVAAARSLGVLGHLEAQWARSDPEFPERTHAMMSRVTAKAWRFEGEMKEIAATFGEAGLPSEFHAAAAEIYHRLAGFKDSNQPPDVDAVIRALLPGVLGPPDA